MATETEVRAQQAQRNVYVFGATSLLNDTASEIAYWILPAFLLSIGAGPAKLGVIEGVAESVASIAKLFSGYLTDRFPRRKPLVVFGYTLANAVKPILAVATAWWQVLIIRFADRTSKGIRGAPRDVMLTESADPARIGSAFGLLQAMDSAGAILGPAIALLLVGTIGYRGVFWVAAIPGVLAIVLVSWLVRETGHGAAKKDRPIFDFGPPAHLPPIFYFVLGAVTLFSIGNSSDMFLVLRAQDVGIPPTHAPLLGLVFNVVYTAASWPAGRWSDRASKPLIAAAGYTVFAIVYLVFALAPSRSAIWAMMAFYGLFYALSNPVLRAMVAQTVAPESRGRAFGFYYFATSVAVLVSSIATGELWKHFGAELPFLISAALAAVSAAMLIAVHRRFEHPHPASQ